jgi:outer membrane protein assembly factor BamA
MHFGLRNFLFVGMIVLPIILHAQDKKFIPLTKYPKGDTLEKPIADTVQQKDLYDVIGAMFGSKHKRAADTVTTKPTFSVVPALGYTLQSKLALTLAGNIAFRLRQNAKISTITINTAYTQTKQIIIPIQSNIWTNNNDYNFIGDIRYLKYPQSTYGLGSSSNIRDEVPMDYSFFRFSEIVLRRIYSNFYAGIGYIADFHWNITHKYPLEGVPPDYANYGTQGHSASSGITFNMLYDSRDNSIKTYHGFYASVQLRDNSNYLGNQQAWQVLITDVRKYFNFPSGSDNVLALWSYNWLVLSGNPPYLDLPANTWDTYSGTGRGYIQGRFRGAQMVYLESEYRFKISANDLFGGVVFVNAQSFSAAQGTRLQEIQPAFGPGLRIKLNKVSRTNIAIDYGIGREGSRGMFINVGEIF